MKKTAKKRIFLIITIAAALLSAACVFAACKPKTDPVSEIPDASMAAFIYTVSGSSYTVTGVKDKNITQIVLPDKVTAVSAGAFEGCVNLTSVTLGSGVKSVGRAAFSNCGSLTSLTVSPENKKLHSAGNCVIETESKTLIAGCKASVIPDDGSVTSIGGYAFENCVGLTAVTIPSNIKTIGYSAFIDCALTSVIIPDGVERIEKLAFGYCAALETLSVADSVKSIGEEAFADTAWYSAQSDGIVYAGKVAYRYKGETAADTSVNLNADTAGIADGAFADCKGLISVSIPSGVKEIGKRAFLNCTSLASAEIPESVEKIGMSAFSGCGALAEITLPFVGGSVKTSADTGQYPLGYIFGTNNFEGGVLTEQSYYAESVKVLQTTAYFIPADLKKVTVTGGEILYGAFQNCKDIINVILKSGVTDVGAYSFNDCKKLTSVVIGGGVKSIGMDAFSGCSGLSDITVSDSVTNIGLEAFEGTKWLENQPVGVVYAGKVVYKYKGSMPSNTEISIEEGTVSISDYAFSKCAGLTSVTLPDSVKSIGKEAFSKCDNLETVNLGSGVSDIGVRAFNYCVKLQSIVIPSGVEKIGYAAFASCKELTSVTLPAGLTQIGDYAFQFCEKLTLVTIPESVVEIGSFAFSYCTALTSVTFENTQGWYAASTANAESGYILVLDDVETNAKRLRDTYSGYYWYRRV